MFRAISYMVTPNGRAPDTQLPGKDLTQSPEDVENKPHITSVDKDNTAKQTAQLVMGPVDNDEDNKSSSRPESIP